ncbi:hypothetical protein Sjap_006133 [Stephania japonica]|uniref:TLDc domain-containing protein n=1 Tax=Stephania japonica TaxID=461633 RepID=A0AAP0PLQ8_9MAGN
MQIWKEKVADKLSQLLADSSPSSPPHFDEDSPIAPPEAEVERAQIKPSSREETRGYRKSFSYLSSFLPRSSSDGYKSIKRHMDFRAIRSLPYLWKSNSFAGKEKQMDSNAEREPGCRNEEVLECIKEDEIGPDFQRSTFDVGNHAEFVTSPTSYIMDESSFISLDLYEFLYSSLPNIVKGRQWILLYSTLRHGISLRTLLRKSVDLPGPCLLIVGDVQGAVFGGLLEGPLIPTAKRKYQVSSSQIALLFSLKDSLPTRGQGINRYYYMCLNDLLAFGGGGNFALRVDEDLLHGTSGPCDTFGNECLAHSPEFELKNVELYTQPVKPLYLAKPGLPIKHSWIPVRFHHMAYPRVRVRVAPEEDLIEEVEKGNGGLDSVKGFDSSSLNGLVGMFMKSKFVRDDDHFEIQKLGNDFNGDSPPTIAKVPKNYVPALATPSVPLCKGDANNKKVVEESRPNIQATSVPRPRAVLSSPDNDEIIGKRKQLSQDRSSLLKRRSPGPNTTINGRISSSCVKAKTTENVKSSLKENTDSKNHLKGKPKPRIISKKTEGVA